MEIAPQDAQLVPAVVLKSGLFSRCLPDSCIFSAETLDHFCLSAWS